MDKYKIDARAKLIITLCLSSIAVFIQNVYVLGFTLVAAILIAMLLGAKLLLVLKSFKKMWFIFAIIVIAQSIFTNAGANLITIGNFSFLSTGGLVKGLEFVLRLAVIVISATIITTSSHREIVQGLIQLKVPYEVAFMVLVAIRFLPIFMGEFRDTVTAIQLRGVDIKRIAFKKKLKMYYYIFNPILINSIKKAHKLSVAMEMRAFRAYPKRTSYLVLKMSLRDYFVILSSVFFTVALIVAYYLFLRGGCFESIINYRA